MTDLKQFVDSGATKNPFGWWPGFYFCVECKRYRHIVHYIRGDENKIFCVECESDMTLGKERKH